MATPLIKVWGIGAQTATVLEENGFKSAEEIAQTTVLSLVEVPGFGPAKAKKVIESARLITAEEQKEAPSVANLKKEEETSTSGKEKKSKKGKKKDKKKKSEKVKKKKKEQKQKKNKKDKKKKDSSKKKK